MVEQQSEVSFAWRGSFGNAEVNRLHAEAFETRLFDESEWNWRDLTERHSMGWVTARTGSDPDTALVGFVNVVWDGFTHAWIQDVMVAKSARHQSIGVHLVAECRKAASQAGCEWLHVDFDDDLGKFYYDACGFKPTSAGLIEL